jgi:hypothetical protein
MIRGYRLHGMLQPVVLAAVGLMALGCGTLGGFLWMLETGFTVAGSVILTAAHLQNWRLRSPSAPGFGGKVP